jgi:tetratricopeptide (TPR) repeat protein
MTFVAEAFAGWLFGQLADASRKHLGEWLLGNDQRRALQQAATAAIWATARQLRPTPAATGDPRGPDHLVQVIDQVFQELPTPAESLADHATLVEGLQAGVVARLAVLEDADITGTGKSSAQLLAVPVPELADLLTRHLLRELVIRGAAGGPLTPLAAQLNHDLTHLLGLEHAARLIELTQEVQAALARLDKRDQQARSIPTGATPPLGRPVHELTDPFALEVHRAIDAPGRIRALPRLPVYIQRKHDRKLQAVVKHAASGRSISAMLVGGSSTGKTRSCWEAVQALPTDWRLWHPIDPSRPEAAAEALPAVRPKTVIWLNEAQHYLLTPASGLGERVAAGLRELLRDPGRGPVLLLGTIWPEYWDILTISPDPEQQEDPHAQARALLTGTDIPVPDAFTGSDLRAVQAAANADPRLAEAAVHAEDGRITQFLAGAPALLERYRNAPAAAKALLEASMDVRRLGHGLYLPHALLAAAAPGYLTDQQWDALGDDWLGQALAYCAKPSRGARGPLTRVRPRPGQPATAQPRYRLADYLEQTGRTLRRTSLGPAALWDALVEHADEQDLVQIAHEAERRSLYRHAFQLYQRAAEAGDSHAMWEAATLLERAGRIEEAIGLYQRAADAGDPDALGRVAQRLEEAGRIDEAIDLYQRAASADEYSFGPSPKVKAVELLEESGRVEEAIDWLKTRAAETGDSFDLSEATRLLKAAGRVDEAIDWLETRAIGSGKPEALSHAAGLLEAAGRIDEAIGLYQRAAEAGDSHSLGQAVELLERAGRRDQAIDWSQARAEAGDLQAFGHAARLLEEAGHLNKAIGQYERAAEAGSRDALGLAAVLLEEAGRVDEAVGLYQRAAKAGDPDALVQAAGLLEEAGRVDEAVGLYQRAVMAGDPLAQGRMAEVLEEAGRIDEAVDLYRHAAEAGDPYGHYTLEQAAEVFERAGRRDEAIRMYQHAAEAGDPHALERAAEMLKAAGRGGEAIDWLQTRIVRSGNPQTLLRAARLLEAAGRDDAAIGLYQHAAEAGDPHALERAAEMLKAAGRGGEAIDWLQTRIVETGGFFTSLRAAELLEGAGRIDEAIGLYLRVAEGGSSYVLKEAARLLEDTGRIQEATRLRRYGLQPGGRIADEWH